MKKCTRQKSKSAWILDMKRINRTKTSLYDILTPETTRFMLGQFIL